MQYLLLPIFIALLSFSFSYASSLCSLEEDNAVQFLRDCARGTIAISPEGGSGTQGVQQRVGSIAKGAISLGALLAVGAIVWAGIQYTKSFADDEKLKKAKSTAIFALIGLILMMLSFSFVDIFIKFLFGLTGRN